MLPAGRLARPNPGPRLNASTLIGHLRLFLDIARFRRGPEDLPASLSLLGFAIVGTGLSRLLMASLLPMGVAANPLVFVAITLAGSALFLALLLRAAGKQERYLQTATASFGFQMVMAPLLLLTAWLFVGVEDSPMWRTPVLLLRLAVELWALAVASRILRAATGWPLPACVVLAVAGEILLFLAVAGLFEQVENPQPPL